MHAHTLDWCVFALDLRQIGYKRNKWTDGQSVSRSTPFSAGFFLKFLWLFWEKTRKNWNFAVIFWLGRVLKREISSPIYLLYTQSMQCSSSISLEKQSNLEFKKYKKDTQKNIKENKKLTERNSDYTAFFKESCFWLCCASSPWPSTWHLTKNQFPY